jgi:hypothetical protein
MICFPSLGTRTTKDIQTNNLSIDSKLLLVTTSINETKFEVIPPQSNHIMHLMKQFFLSPVLKMNSQLR